MKQILTLVLLLFLAGITKSQNVKSNDYIRAEVISQQQVKVTNLQTCRARVKGTLPNGVEVVSDYIASGDFTVFMYKDCGTFHFYPVDSTCTKVARCDLSINSCLFVLPVKAGVEFRQDKDELYVEVKNGNPAKPCTVRITNRDGSFKDVTFPLVNKIGNNYWVKIKL